MRQRVGQRSISPCSYCSFPGSARREPRGPSPPRRAQYCASNCLHLFDARSCRDDGRKDARGGGMGLVAVDEATEWSSRTVVVVVTYGDRAELAIASTEAALRAGVAAAVLVDNGSRLEARDRLHAFATSRPGDVTLVQRPENTGSAGGFSAGLQMALRCTEDWILFLDDD